MAHINYACCAICDVEVFVSPKESIKNVICGDCYCKFEDMGYYLHYISDFMDFIENTETEKLISILKEVDFHMCLYSNDVDRAVYDKLGKRVAIFQ